MGALSLAIPSTGVQLAWSEDRFAPRDMEHP